MHNINISGYYTDAGCLFEYCGSSKDACLRAELTGHAFYEIYMIYSGNIECIIEGQIYRLRAGDIFIVNINDIFKTGVISMEKPCEYNVIRLHKSFFEHIKNIGDDITGFFEEVSQRGHHLIRPGRIYHAALTAFYSMLDRETQSTRKGHVMMAYSAVLAIIISLSRAYYEISASIRTDIAEDPHVNQALDYINNHLSERLTVGLIAGKLFISKSHLSHQFKKYTGYPVYDYITKKRLVMARRKICEGEPATSAYIECGFSDYSNFLKVFKREFGFGPGFFAKTAVPAHGRAADGTAGDPA